jgi:hypothetical protein
MYITSGETGRKKGAQKSTIGGMKNIGSNELQKVESF